MSMGSYNNWAFPNNNWSWNQQLNNQPVNNVFRVTGPESARAYSIPPKSNVVLFDAENPIFYWKTTDDAGYPTPLRAFKFEEIQLNEQLQLQSTIEQIDTSNFVTKDDLDAVKENVVEIKNLLEGLVN